VVHARSGRPALVHPPARTADLRPLLRTPARQPQEGAGAQGGRAEAGQHGAGAVHSRPVRALALEDYPSLRESKIEQAIIDNLQAFLLELGKGFSFVARQKRIRFEDEDFYVDLVFYNYLLRCFVLIDLKVGALTHQDIGQMDSYVRVFDAHARPRDDNPTIGLILCSKKNEAIARYSVLAEGKRLFAAKYVKVLPTEAELQREIERERRLIEQQRVTGAKGTR
jgi:hypothetical protein